MRVSRILCPVDFSSISQALVRYAETIAQHYQADLHLVHVRELHIPYGGSMTLYNFGEPERDKLLATMNAMVAEDSSIKVESHVIDGDAIRAIVKFAEELETDLIVIGTHGRTGLAHVLMGSVAEHVVRKAHCPVLALKHPESFEPPELAGDQD